MTLPPDLLRDARSVLQAGDQESADASTLISHGRRASSTDTPKLRCPFCRGYLSKVVDSRAIGGSRDPVIRRRRVCLECAARFSTHERVLPVSRKTA